jgi:hypothetical protein
MLRKYSAVLVLGFSVSLMADKYTELPGLATLPSYDVQWAKGPITVDGSLSESSWARAVAITLIFPWESQTGKKQKTTVKLLRDQELLYVGYEAEDDDITARYTQRDDPTYEEDCVEIFIRPGLDSETYVGMEMNARGTLFDYLYPFPKELDKSFNLDGVQLKTTQRGTLNQRNDHDQGWTLELAIPFKNFKTLAREVSSPRKHDRWRVQINRWDGSEDSGGRRLSMWCHSGMKDTNPHNPERFGFLNFP